MSEPKHTPLPWSAESRNGPAALLPNEGAWGVSSPKGHIARLAGPRAGYDAALIVRAVNCHDKLVAALEAAAKSLESIWAGRAEGGPEDHSDARWQVRAYAKSRADVARAALSEARPEGGG